MIKICLLGLAILLSSGIIGLASAGRVDVYNQFLTKDEVEHFLDSPLEIHDGGVLSTGYGVLKRATAQRIHEMTGLGDQTKNDFYDSKERSRVLQTQKLKSSSSPHRDRHWNMDDGSPGDAVDGKVGIIFLETNPDAALADDLATVH